MLNRVSCEMGGRPLSIETGKLARQADGSAFVSYGDTRVLVTVCSSKEPKEGIDFFPLTVEFSEKFYAAGKIPGSFHKREGRPTQEATLSARMIDRPIRPLFPEGYFYDTQIIASILSMDAAADAEIAAAIGASAALHLSNIPFNGPTAACRIGKANGSFIINPTWSQINSDELSVELLIAGTKNAIMMVEGGAQEASEEEILEAIVHGHQEIKKVIEIIHELRNNCGKPKRPFTPASIPTHIQSQVKEQSKTDLIQALKTKDKQTRLHLAHVAKKKALESLVPDSLKNKQTKEGVALEKTIQTSFDLLQYELMREMILSEGIRIDGRDSTTIRPISVETGLLPRTHGSALFTRGETQVLSTVTLGTSDDEQIVDTMFQNAMRKFMLHYNFPPFSVGETGRMGGQSRREIGHGALAERSIKTMMPAYDKFPYTIRIVCETLESNGSSSMASVCSASMALMDAGAPLPKPVAGIAMGLIKENNRIAILSDILGDEDFLGDMDFKVAGTKDGITGIQMDIKIEGVDASIMQKALEQAHQGRLHILGEMSKAIDASRLEISKFAPKIITITVPLDKIREVIGTGGKVVKDIIAQTGCKIDIQDDGKINIASSDSISAQKAIDMIKSIIATVEVGTIYKGTIRKIVEFGAFVNILPNLDGLLHISEIAYERVQHVHDHFKEGDSIEVKVIEVDKFGKIRLSRKVLLAPQAGAAPNTKNTFNGNPKRT